MGVVDDADNSLRAFYPLEPAIDRMQRRNSLQRLVRGHPKRCCRPVDGSRIVDIEFADEVHPAFALVDAD